MRGLLCAVHALVFVLVLVSSPERSSGFIGKILDELHRFDKNVLRKVVTALGLRRIRKTYQEFKQEVVHSKVTFTADSYRVEKIVPCPDGQHDIMDAEQPVEIYFEDGVKIIQDRYCRKCGQHFFGEAKRKDEL